MRDTNKEANWFNHPIIGYVSLDEQGQPLRRPRSGYTFLTQEQKGYHPPRVYQTIEMAVKQSPCKSAAEVRMFVPIEVPDQ